jgi:acyl carrier protein
MSFDLLKRLIADGLGVEESEVKMDSDLTNDLGADSLDAAELIMAIEDEFHVSVDDEIAQNLKTVGQIWEFIESQKQ